MVTRLTHTLPADDDTELGFGVVGEGISLLRRLASAPTGDFNSLKEEAKAWVARHDQAQEENRLHQKHRLAPDRSADAWVFDMFRATESAISREQLVADFIGKYRTERKVVDHDRHNGPWLFEFFLQTQDGQARLLPGQCAGVHPAAFAAACEDLLSEWQSDPYLSSVFEQKEEFDARHPIWWGSSALFDRLLNVAHRPAGEADYWVCATALLGDGLQSTRGVFLLHPNGGTLAQPRFPPGMKQDQRLLLALSLAWRQLEHQIKGLAKISESERRNMINLLAPGVLFHEVGNSMADLERDALALHAQLGPWATANPQAEYLTEYADTANSLVQKARRVYEVTDVFNNLDKRAAIEETTVHDVLAGVHLLSRHRLAHLGVDFRWPEGEFGAMAVRTDAVLLTQALLNMVSNALNSFEESNSPFPRRIRVSAAPRAGSTLTLIIANNGPAIAQNDQPFLFQRGYSTRSGGHGQGLYLSRLIARYLGGDLRLAEGVVLKQDMRVGFKLSLTADLPAVWSLGHATLEASRR